MDVRIPVRLGTGKIPWNQFVTHQFFQIHEIFWDGLLNKSFTSPLKCKNKIESNTNILSNSNRNHNNQNQNHDISNLHEINPERISLDLNLYPPEVQETLQKYESINPIYVQSSDIKKNKFFTKRIASEFELTGKNISH